ncbi:carbamoyltransferase C-terminal domain-containing protein [Novipirellula sp. SH528]|uniref:carbamoyltransferase C-terminal domain-containing protein n=1 Tax=Novipirellula sp. SH528 TaxID=3454466 RepID=UPI003FA157C5
MSVVLGIHSCGHDTGVAVFRHGVLEYAIETERLTRRKHDGRVEKVLEHLANRFPGIDREITLVAASTNLNGRALGIRPADEHLAQDCISKGGNQFLTRCSPFGIETPCLVVAHEASHATLACHFAGWQEGTLAFVNEGNGSFSRNSAYIYQDQALALVDSDTLPWFGTGIGWTGVSWFLGMGKSPSCAGKVMALSAYHHFDDGDLRPLLRELPSNLHALSDDKRLQAANLVRSAGSEIVDSERMQFALPKALQSLFTESLKNEIQRLVSLTNAKNVALSGGCALNLPTNTVLRELYPNLAIPPACNDSGHALGAALYALRFHLSIDPSTFSVWSNGPDTTSEPKIDDHRFESSCFDPKVVARYLDEGKVIAYCDGVAAIGPRSLGNRSLLGNPETPGMRSLVSEKIKKREWFRPLAPIMTDAAFSKHFPNQPLSPHMLYQYQMPQLFLPEATHVDNTARIQTVPAAHSNPRLVAILDEFYAATGVPGLINTSLNARNKAIACNYMHVLDDFENAPDVHAFVFGDHILTRK